MENSEAVEEMAHYRSHAYFLYALLQACPEFIPAAESLLAELVSRPLPENDKRRLVQLQQMIRGNTLPQVF